MWLAWLIFGAIFGGMAASTRGFSSAGGVIGGAVLGLFAPLLFFVPPPRACPHCGERIRVEAVVCKHCRRDVPIEPHPAHTSEGMTSDEKAQAWRIVLGFVAFIAVMIAVGYFRNR